MTTAQIRNLDVNEIRKLMHELGLNIEGIQEANEGLTRLFENALSIEDID
jgi:hypothetical protein